MRNSPLDSEGVNDAESTPPPFDVHERQNGRIRRTGLRWLLTFLLFSTVAAGGLVIGYGMTFWGQKVYEPPSPVNASARDICVDLAKSDAFRRPPLPRSPLTDILADWGTPPYLKEGVDLSQENPLDLLLPYLTNIAVLQDTRSDADASTIDAVMCTGRLPAEYAAAGWYTTSWWSKRRPPEGRALQVNYGVTGSPDHGYALRLPEPMIDGNDYVDPDELEASLTPPAPGTSEADALRERATQRARYHVERGSTYGYPHRHTTPDDLSIILYAEGYSPIDADYAIEQVTPDLVLREAYRHLKPCADSKTQSDCVRNRLQTKGFLWTEEEANNAVQQLFG